MRYPTEPQRWYEIIDGVAYVYDAPFPAKATSCSVVAPAALSYYRSNFALSKVWTCNTDALHRFNYAYHLGDSDR